DPGRGATVVRARKPRPSDMSQSLIYRHPALYVLVMRLLYGRHHAARQRAVADLVPEGSAVVELCCGPGLLYFGHLRGRGVEYLGLDLNERFVAQVRRRGARAEVADLRRDEALPEADYLVIQAALYHFLPDPDPVLARMLDAARRAVIVAE